MMKKFKRYTAQLVLAVFVFSITLGNVVFNGGLYAFADVNETSLVVMGDSISYGMSADSGKGMADLYLKHLIERDGKAKLTNLSVPGYKASDLLEKLPTQPYSEALAVADVVVVSIGGNHLLSPVIEAVAKAFQVNRTSPTLLADLSNAVKNDPNAAATMMKLQSSEYLLELSKALEAGVGSFKTEFPKVITEIKKQAPKAQVYVLDLYNPFNSKDTMNLIFNPYITNLNGVITPQAEALGYTVVPVNKVFAENAGSVVFSLSEAKLDPHPTNIGHDLISKQLVSVEKPKSTGGNASGGQTIEEVKNEPKGITEAQKLALNDEIKAVKLELTAVEKAIKKTSDDIAKLDKDYKALKAKVAKLKTKADKNKANLQLVAMVAKKKAYTSWIDYKKAIIVKDKMIVSKNQAILDKYEQSPEAAPLTQEELDSITKSKEAADMVIVQKKAMADKAAAEASKAAQNAAKAK